MNLSTDSYCYFQTEKIDLTIAFSSTRRVEVICFPTFLSASFSGGSTENKSEISSASERPVGA